MGSVQRSGTPTMDRRGWVAGSLSFATLVPSTWALLPVSWPVALGLSLLGAAVALVAFAEHGRFWATRYPGSPHTTLWMELATRVVLVAGATAAMARLGDWVVFIAISAPWALVNWRVHQTIVKGITGYRADVAVVAWGLMLGGLGVAAWASTVT